MSIAENKAANVEEFTSFIEDWTADENVRLSQIESFANQLDYVGELVNKGLSKQELIKELQDLMTYVATDSHNA